MRYDLDCIGIKCPMPIVKVGQKIRELNIDDELRVICDDLAFIADIKAWAKATRHELVRTVDEVIKEALIRKNK